MSGLLGGPKPTPTPPAPMIDDAVSKINEEDRVGRRQGRKSTILTSDTGLPDLGKTTRTGQ